MMKRAFVLLTVIIALLCPTTVVFAQRARRPAGTVSLPYNISDSQGNQWTIYQNAMLQQRGNMPIFSQGAMLMVNGDQINSNTNRATRDDKTGELVFDGFNINGVNVTRRVLVRPDAGYVRYIDVFKNLQPQAQSLNVQLQTRVNFGVINTQNLADPSNAENSLAWIAQTQANRAAIVISAGKGTKHAMTFMQQNDQNLGQADLPLTLPPSKEVAVMTVYATAASIDAGTQFVTSLKDNDLLKDCSIEIRREIVNFNTTESFVGDREILRGTSNDVIELRGGNPNGALDQLHGTLKDPSFTVHTFYGDVTLPADHVVGMISIGQFRPRQLMVTSDGQVFGGQLAKATVTLELFNGQTADVPLAQIARFGYRKRPNEPENTDLSALPVRPMVLLRSGDRIAIAAPDGPIAFLSRYGALSLPTRSISAVSFQSDENSVHTLYLTDGSHLSGLLQMQQLTVQLAGTGSATQPAATQPETSASQTVTIPIAAIARLQLTAMPGELDDQTPTLQLSNNDLLVGRIDGDLKVDTAFDTLNVPGSEVHTLNHARDAGSDVQILMWDQTRLSGSINAVEIPFKLVGGTTISAPVALIDAYTQPQPQASAAMKQQIQATVKDLAADDWKQREKAEAALVAMGTAVVPELKQLEPAQPPEAQERIEAVVRKLTDKKKSAGAAGGGDAPVLPQD
ncbi:MAG: hypothetical protein JO353_11805 [Phycisphaerae bacterium]|nr:hypothetical protein [Phycisphaerae bacterium]